MAVTAAITLDQFGMVKRALPVILLVALWCWETWQPFFGRRDGRWLHASRNLALALFNTIAIGLVLGSITVTIALWTEEHRFGLLMLWHLPESLQFLLTLLLLDGWMYFWHRANHTLHLLWRFHRVHHTDRNMDVTTATRFHLGEQVVSSLLRLGLIPLLGISIWPLIVYDAIVLSTIMFHHADISLGRWDRRLRWLIVTPDMHKIHHSDCEPETNSNYSTVLSVWDRLARSFRMRNDLRAIDFGLKEFPESSWQTWWGMWKTPLTAVQTMVEPTKDTE